VQAGGTVVRSGDVVVGDGDGVVVLPHERAAEVVALAQARLRDEEEQFAQIAAGTLDRSWVLKTLTEVHVDGEGTR
jgi:regulator of RNase E activity RraA